MKHHLLSVTVGVSVLCPMVSASAENLFTISEKSKDGLKIYSAHFSARPDLDTEELKLTMFFRSFDSQNAYPLDNSDSIYADVNVVTRDAAGTQVIIKPVTEHKTISFGSDGKKVYPQKLFPCEIKAVMTTQNETLNGNLVISSAKNCSDYKMVAKLVGKTLANFDFTKNLQNVKTEAEAADVLSFLRLAHGDNACFSYQTKIDPVPAVLKEDFYETSLSEVYQSSVVAHALKSTPEEVKKSPYTPIALASNLEYQLWSKYPGSPDQPLSAEQLQTVLKQSSVVLEGQGHGAIGPTQFLKTSGNSDRIDLVWYAFDDDYNYDSKKIVTLSGTFSVATEGADTKLVVTFPGAEGKSQVIRFKVDRETWGLQFEADTETLLVPNPHHGGKLSEVTLRRMTTQRSECEA